MNHATDEDLFCHSARFLSPTSKRKPSRLKNSSIFSVNTSVTQHSSISISQDNFKHSNDSLQILKDKLVQIQSEFPTPEPSATEVPTLKWCAFCKGEKLTETIYLNTEKTFWASVAIFLSGGVFGCFMLPYSLDSCKEGKIRCHLCKRLM